MTINNKNYEIISYSDIHKLAAQEIQDIIQKNTNIWYKEIPNEGGKYSYWIENLFVMTCAKEDIKVDNKNKYKFHIAIDDAKNTGGKIDPNLQRGYDIASKTLQKNNVYMYKVELPGFQLGAVDPGQARKQITIYSGEEGDSRKLEQWTEIMDDIVLSFVDNEVRPKPEFNGEQDVRVKGSNYITYRNEEARREIGGQYMKSDSSDPLKDMRLSDILYAQLLELANSNEELTQKKIQLVVDDNLRYNGTNKDNLMRIWQHIEDKKPIMNTTKAAMIQNTLAAISRNLSNKTGDNTDITPPDRLNEYEETTQYEYEETTQYSKAAAEYNQLILNVVDAIADPATKAMPEWWSFYFNNAGAYRIALEWRVQDSKWNNAKGYDRENIEQTIVPGMCVLAPKLDEFIALTSDEAIAAYKTERVCLADLAIFDADKIKALVSPEAVEAYTQGKFTVKNLAQYTADEIKDKVKQGAVYKLG